MYEILMIAFLVVALVLIGFIMLQQGKGADMGASFGSGASNTVFGSSGSGNFLTRATAGLAVVFFILSLVLGNLSTSTDESSNDFSDLSVPAEEQELPPADDKSESESEVPPID
ncbi:MAG TPA: preprotein translocase subunit SecG [Idiomarina loihiensis]|jgi:preprotein translocase subunit SecG|uniref:Protein-export membrane protein SecG n=1 Tax=Idiomarina loihiensis (strain ATCC BAA-735 / DSM 15497 / L2-TR) TaxID=283942 RepID=Q5R0R4_IDILO|nr:MULTISPECIES: preprotein translocase subunit SecG [Idiomarina]HAS21685.1 preprotein translocase subunit SecG [Idiomarina loihiensis]AAV81811.1 Biopolymer transport protein [Idiomarina loihiensis L2TR]AGM35841.1 biopolymer transport protein [Idiomarina loihiensis GSL 199]MBL4857006.1 preprotein translocase subunit SecG [Idiomarina sp.]PHQ90730.1 MAG: preprotein translocase subunit SecG [Idiomarina sp.]|tara:strand:+ start:2045 stop:2386 length:342 start_codon:yes stop_codon:yes gene_type:complete